MGKRLTAFLALFSSVSTLVCCALPALFVVLGMGAAFAGLVTAVPQLIWISEHKVYFFAFGGAMLILAGVFQYRSRALACPTDADMAAACSTTKDWSKWIYVSSLALYALGAIFAFAPGLLG